MNPKGSLAYALLNEGHCFAEHELITLVGMDYEYADEDWFVFEDSKGLQQLLLKEHFKWVEKLKPNCLVLDRHDEMNENVSPT